MLSELGTSKILLGDVRRPETSIDSLFANDIKDGWNLNGNQLTEASPSSKTAPALCLQPAMVRRDATRDYESADLFDIGHRESV